MGHERRAEPDLPYVPRSYRSTRSDACVLWTSYHEVGDHRACLQAWIHDAAGFLSRVLAFQPHRRLHVVSFLTNEEARRAL
ncbi:MAG: hypothetical protein PHW86_07890, partial [Candidatus Bipolaricaulis sp.]|nr:hypothetical protein [Candidatus Bipolaricaulis sp.]